MEWEWACSGDVFKSGACFRSDMTYNRPPSDEHCHHEHHDHFLVVVCCDLVRHQLSRLQRSDRCQLITSTP